MKKVVRAVMLAAVFSAVYTVNSNAQIKNNPTVNKSDTLHFNPKEGDEIYTCEMDEEVISDHPGKCPECGMPLLKRKMTAAQARMMKEGTYIKPKE